MMCLRRHDLVWLSAQGWRNHVLRDVADSEAADCLRHWFAQRLPLVVGRQTPGESQLALGLAAPAVWDRRKIALKVPRDCVLYHDRFPKAAEIRSLLSPGLRKRWLSLCGDLGDLASNPRVHGSYGWQQITGLEYIAARSDIDLQLSVGDADTADRVTSLLERFTWKGPRIDGELLFPTGAAVAWREWLQWRRGAVDRVMVKRLYGVALVKGLEWLQDQPAVAT